MIGDVQSNEVENTFGSRSVDVRLESTYPVDVTNPFVTVIYRDVEGGMIGGANDLGGLIPANGAAFVEVYDLSPVRGVETVEVEVRPSNVSKFKS